MDSDYPLIITTLMNFLDINYDAQIIKQYNYAEAKDKGNTISKFLKIVFFEAISILMV